MTKQATLLSQKSLSTLSGFALFIVIVYFLLKRFGHIDAVGKIKNVLRGIFHGLQSIRFIKRKGLFVFHSVMIWTLYLFEHHLRNLCLAGNSAPRHRCGLTTLAVGSVGMVLTPGGIGAYPLLVSNLMGLYGLDETTIGNALGWLLWSVQNHDYCYRRTDFNRTFFLLQQNKKTN